MAAKTRNSSIELLRILCIFGIIFMHTIAYGGDELSQMNRYLLIFANCFTNLGVTCFMLISGYFGVRFNLQKLIKLDLMVSLHDSSSGDQACTRNSGRKNGLALILFPNSFQPVLVLDRILYHCDPVRLSQPDSGKTEKRAVREAAIILPFPVLCGADLPPF